MAIHDEFGVPATFFLNSGKLGLTAAESGFKDYVDRDDVISLYGRSAVPVRHEIGGHTVDHPDLTRLPDETIAQQIGADRHALATLSGAAPMGFAAPFGRFDARVRRIAADIGYRYARGVDSTGSFEVPHSLMDWQPTAHCADVSSDLWMSFVEALARGAQTPGGLLLFTWWGHSYEYEDELGWDRLRDQLSMIASTPGVWLATMGDVASALMSTVAPDSHSTRA